MAFTGSATVTSLGTLVVRITGLSLAASASGTVGLTGGGSNVSLPTNFPSTPDAGAGSLTMADLVDVRFQRATGGTQASFLDVSKTATPFVITITNPDAVNASGPLEIYVQYFYSAER